MHIPRCFRSTAARAAAIAAAASWLVGAAHAQFKVVGPDGSVTYTDRPPATATPGRVTEMGRRVSPEPATPAGPALPADLARLAQRFPVTLYTSANCAPCDAGRTLLQARGVPYTERTVATNEDIAAFERIAGGRTLPALTIGAQALTGFSDIDWAAYLDAAGYPRTSRLPAGWAAAPATPLVARASGPPPAAPPTPVPAPQAAAAPEAPATPAAPPPAEGTIRF